MPCQDGMRPEDIEYLLSDDALPLAHRKVFDLPEMDEITIYRPPFEYPRAPIPTGLTPELRERVNKILRDAGEPTIPKSAERPSSDA